MKKLTTILLAFFFIPLVSQAAIALVSHTDGVTDDTFSANVGSGSNRYACAMMKAGTNSSPSTVSVGSDSLSQIYTITAYFSRRLEAWCGPLTVDGTQTVSYTGSLADGMGHWSLVVYSGVDTVAGVGDYGTNSGNDTTPIISLTASDGDWLVGNINSESTDVEGGTDTREIYDINGDGIADSNGVSSPSALNWTQSGGNWWTGGLVLSPAAGGGGGEEGTTTTATTTPGNYDGPSLQEWLFVAMVFLFFISFSAWPRIFKPIKETFYGN